MLLYYGYAFPLSTRIARGFYRDGVWSDTGFMRWGQISAVAWKEEGGVTLVLISRLRSLARPLHVPGDVYVVYRLRRPHPGRGYEVRIVATHDGIHYETVWVASKDEFVAESIERCALVRAGRTWRLYASYVWREDRRWRIGLLEAPSVDAFDSATLTPVDGFTTACGLARGLEGGTNSPSRVGSRLVSPAREGSDPNRLGESVPPRPEKLGTLSKRDTKKLFRQLTSGAALLRAGPPRSRVRAR